MGVVLYPRCYVGINGLQIPVKKFNIRLKSAGNASEFSATFSATDSASQGMQLNDWADFQPTDVSILLSLAFGGGDIQPMIIGQIDVPKINWNDMTIDVSGRDKSAPMMESRRSEKFASQTSSEIVSQVASDYGLSPQVTTTGSDMAGKQYNDGDINHLVIHKNDAELLNELADRENCRWYVNQNNLIFEPKDSQNDVYQVIWVPPDPITGEPMSSVLELTTSRNMTAAKTTQVNVKSWHHKQSQQFNGSAMAQGVGSDTVNIDHHHNGKTQDQVDNLAMSRANDVIRHDCNMSFKSYFDPDCQVNGQAQLSGTNTIYDQIYDVDEVEISGGWEEGAEMEVTCKAPKAGRSVSQGGSSDGADSAPGDGGDGSSGGSSADPPTPPPRPPELGGAGGTVST